MTAPTYNDNYTSDKCVLIKYWKTNQDNENELIAIPGYRKYTPGHWEDADGNWINGSWGNWIPYDESCPEVLAFGTGTFAKDGWSFSMGPLYESPSDINENYSKNINANILMDSNMKFLYNRTWNNAKPAA